MLEWIINNIPAIAICTVLLAVVVSVVVYLVRRRKKGHSSCGCGCSSCPMNDSCHKK